ncbi:MAG TPA: MFS transporter [Armatimonadota bacterium]|nr:MFS transporter [Armatimonadota bacterium]
MNKGVLGLSRTVILLGFVSLLTDLSSDMLIPLIPIFLTTTIGAPVWALGLIEGVSESIASILRIYAGWLSDRFGRPKLLATSGYGLSSFAKPFLAIATNWLHVFAVRVADRFGKGVRSAPRDVIITETTAPEIRGRAFGFHRTMDTTGAVLGPLVAYAILLAFQGDNGNAYRTVFLIGAVPALVAVAILGIFIPEKPKEARPMQPPKVKWSTFSRQLKHFLLIVAVFSVGNSSDAFLIIRATNVGVEVENVLLIYALFNLVSAIFSLPAGIASDKVGRGPLLLSGFIVFIATYLGFAMASTPLVVWILFSVYGLYVGLTAGVLRAYAADVAPAELRGTAIGAYYTVEGISLLAASTIAGLLWTYISPSAPFYYGAVMALFASVLLLFLMPKKNH